MRSIGKRNIALVKQITLDELSKKNPYICSGNTLLQVEEKIVARLPGSMFDTWEMADQEIRNIINDTIMQS